MFLNKKIIIQQLEKIWNNCILKKINFFGKTFVCNIQKIFQDKESEQVASLVARVSVDAPGD
jgi:hypothetical protein